MYLPPNTRLIHKTNNRLTLITVFCFRVDPVTFVTSYETQDILIFLDIFICENHSSSIANMRANSVLYSRKSDALHIIYSKYVHRP